MIPIGTIFIVKWDIVLANNDAGERCYRVISMPITTFKLIRFSKVQKNVKYYICESIRLNTKGEEWRNPLKLINPNCIVLNDHIFSEKEIIRYAALSKQRQKFPQNLHFNCVHNIWSF